MKKYWLSWLMLAVALAVTLFTYHALPENMAVHWGIDGQADGFAPKWIASLMVPLLMVAMILMLHLLPKIDPNRKNYEQFQGAYNMISAGIVSLLFVLHLVVILQGLGYSIPIPTLMTFLVGALFILIGNYLPRVRTNFFLGIRTPWTLSDEEVWRKTHRIGGKNVCRGRCPHVAGQFAPVNLAIYRIDDRCCDRLPWLLHSFLSLLQAEAIVKGRHPNRMPLLLIIPRAVAGPQRRFPPPDEACLPVRRRLHTALRRSI